MWTLYTCPATPGLCSTEDGSQSFTHSRKTLYQPKYILNVTEKVFFKQTMNTHDHGDTASWLNILGSAGSYTSRNLALDPNLLAGVGSAPSKKNCYGYHFI